MNVLSAVCLSASRSVSPTLSFTAFRSFHHFQEEKRTYTSGHCLFRRKISLLLQSSLSLEHSITWPILLFDPSGSRLATDGFSSRHAIDCSRFLREHNLCYQHRTVAFEDFLQECK